MDENVGKSPDRVENVEWQSRPKLDAEVVSDDFALGSAGQAMTSSVRRHRKRRTGPSCTGAREGCEILPRSLRPPWWPLHLQPRPHSDRSSDLSPPAA